MSEEEVDVMVPLGLGDLIAATPALVLSLSLTMGWGRLRRTLPGLVRVAGDGVAVGVRLLAALLVLDGLVGTLVLPAVYMVGPEMATKLPVSGWHTYRVPVTTARGHQIGLSAAVWQPEAAASRRDLTLVFMCPNGAGFELLESYLRDYALDLGATRIVAFNFRGVGASQGWPTRAQDLVDDATAVVRHTVEVLGADEESLLIHGWSLGGAVALGVRQAYPKAVLVSDRSFSRLSDAAASMLADRATAGSIGVFAGFLISFVVSHDLSAALELSKYLCGGVGAAFALGALEPILPLVLRTLEWEIDFSHPALVSSAPVCCVFHREDMMIKFDRASLCNALQHKGADAGVFAFEMRQIYGGGGGFPQHNAPINLHAGEWQDFLKGCALAAFSPSET